jgi:hypothetical protein
MRKRLILTVVASVFLLAAQSVNAGTFQIFGDIAGSEATIPLDLDNDNCTTVGTSTVCNDFSELTTYSLPNFNNTSGGSFLKGSWKGQATTEVSAVVGSGCSIDKTIASCTIGTTTNGCLFTFDGGSYVNLKDGTADVVFGFINAGGSECIDFTSFPFSFSIKESGTIIGGTGRFSGLTGSFSETLHGQELSADLQGRNFSWLKGNFSGTATIP